MAIRIASPALEAMRDELSDAFAGLLMPQDTAAWQPHVTIQNKVSATEARALRTRLGAEFRSRPIRIDGLGSWTYQNGLWQPVSRHMFRG